MRSSTLTKVKKAVLAVTLAAGTAGLFGCVQREVIVERQGPPPQALPPQGPPPQEVVVEQEPPQPYPEVIGVAPGPDVVWVGGVWVWGGGGYVWHRGYWGHRPHAGAFWVRDRWEHRGRGWVQIRGHWN